MLWSATQHVVELTVPWEDAIEMAYERKKLRDIELAAEEHGRKVPPRGGWRKVSDCSKDR